MLLRHSRIDAAKVLASNLIVLHHFTVYGPLADALHLAAPRLADFLFDYARMAVQVFLVIGGYFAANTLASQGNSPLRGVLRKVTQRYARLLLPLGAALLLVILCSAWARHWLQADFIPAAPGLLQILAHAGLAHSVLGLEPLSVGLWYVAIDFQLFTLMAILVWAGKHRAQWLVALVMLASLFVFNLDAGGDNWAPYFFGSYGMGAVAWWAAHSRHAPKRLGALALVGAMALVWDFRMRIAVALAVALWLGLSNWRTSHNGVAPSTASQAARSMEVMGRCSYALFLTHFCVLMLANVAWTQLQWTFAGSAVLVTLLAWGACVGLAVVFERRIERPLQTVRLP